MAPPGGQAGVFWVSFDQGSMTGGLLSRLSDAAMLREIAKPPFE
jgi:hypothetical protein